MGTPYEIRAELLSRAEGLLIGRYHADFEKCNALKDMETMKNLKYPTVEDIIALASTLKTFVDTK